MIGDEGLRHRRLSTLSDPHAISECNSPVEGNFPPSSGEVRVGVPLTQEQVRVMSSGHVKAWTQADAYSPENDPELVPLVSKTVEEREAWIEQLKQMHGIPRSESANARWGRGWWCFWKDLAKESESVRRTKLGRRALSRNAATNGKEEVVLNERCTQDVMPGPPLHPEGKERPDGKDQMIGHHGEFFNDCLPPVPDWVPMHLLPDARVLREYIYDAMEKRRMDPVTGEIIGMTKQEWNAIEDPGEKEEKRWRVFAVDWDTDFEEFYRTFMCDDIDEDPKELAAKWEQDPYLRNKANADGLDIKSMLQRMVQEDVGMYPPSEPRSSLVTPAPAENNDASEARSRSGQATSMVRRSSTQRSAASLLRRDSIGVVVPPALNRSITEERRLADDDNPKKRVSRGWYGPKSIVTEEDRSEAFRFLSAFFMAFLLLRGISLAINGDFEFLMFGLHQKSGWIDTQLLVSVLTMWTVSTFFDLALTWCMKFWGMSPWFVRKLSKFSHIFVPFISRIVYASECKEPATDLAHRFLWGVFYTYLPSLKAVRRADGLWMLTTPLQAVHLCRWAILQNVSEPFTLWHPFAEQTGSMLLLVIIELLAAHAFGVAKPQAWSLLALSCEFWADAIAALSGRMVAGNPADWNLQRVDLYGMPKPPSRFEQFVNATAFRVRSLYTTTGVWLGYEPEGDDDFLAASASSPVPALGAEGDTLARGKSDPRAALGSHLEDPFRGDLKREARKRSFIEGYGPTPAHDLIHRRSSIPALRNEVDEVGGTDDGDALEAGAGHSTQKRNQRVSSRAGGAKGEGREMVDPNLRPVDPTLQPQGTPRRTPIGCLTFFVMAFSCVYLQIDTLGASRHAIARITIPVLATLAEALSPARFDGVGIVLAALVGMIASCAMAPEDAPAFSFPNRFDTMVPLGPEPAWWRYNNNITMIDGIPHRWNATHCGPDEQFPWKGTLGVTLDPACFARVPKEEIPVYPRDPKITTYPFV